MAIKKTTTKKIAATKKEVSKYILIMEFNGEVYKIKTNNLRDSILSVKPELLFTELYLSISDGEMTLEKRLNLVQGKRLFLSEDTLDVFITNLLF